MNARPYSPMSAYASKASTTEASRIVLRYPFSEVRQQRGVRDPTIDLALRSTFARRRATRPPRAPVTSEIASPPASKDPLTMPPRAYHYRTAARHSYFIQRSAWEGCSPKFAYTPFLEVSRSPAREPRARLERVMNSIRNGLGIGETEIAREPSRPWKPHFYAVFTQVHNTL